MFQGSILVVDIVTFRLNLPRGQFSENYLKSKTWWEGIDGVTIRGKTGVSNMFVKPDLRLKPTPV